MKSLPVLALVVLGTLSSCEKIRNPIDSLRKKPVAARPAHADPLVTEITDDSYAGFIARSNQLVIVDFYADWCGPCRRLAPILDQIAAEQGGTILIGKVNIDKCRALATREGIRSIPDVRMFRDGKLVDKFIGLPAASEVRRRIDNQLKELPAPEAPGVPEAGGAGASKPKEAVIQPMPKDWKPAGIQRR